MMPKLTDLELMIGAIAVLTILALTFFLIYSVTLRKDNRTFWCLTKNKAVTARLLASPFFKRYIDVIRCSAFKHARIDCQKECLTQLKK